MTVYASVDLGGTTVSAGLAGDDGQFIALRDIPTESYRGPKDVLARIGAMIKDLSKDTGLPAAIGMGVPGLVDVMNGVTTFLPNMPTHWKNVPAAEILSQAVGCPVYLLNDVRMATLGELKYGRGRDVDSMAFFALGTGVGGGIVIDGKLRLGSVGAAGELGHLTLLPDGPLCGCGNRGCLEALASGPALRGEAVRMMLSGHSPRLFEMVNGDVGKVTPKEIGAAAREGDTGAKEAIAHAAHWLGIAVVNVVITLHPQLVVLGGGISLLDDLLIDPVQQMIRDRVRMIPPETVRVERSSLEDLAGMHGGIALAQLGGVKP
ncbi:MAG TPA: ROK family protein [Planctomycetaceae bacterium]|nr:ROK family protein [Planctomycetaceae bacterium]